MVARAKARSVFLARLEAARSAGAGSSMTSSGAGSTTGAGDGGELEGGSAVSDGDGRCG